AQALATLEFGLLSPLAVAQPPASTNSRCRHVSIACSSLSFPDALACCMKRETHDGVSATTTAALERSTASRSAVPPSIHPIQENPTIIVSTPPMTTPQTAGLSHGTLSFMRGLRVLAKKALLQHSLSDARPSARALLRS